MLIRDRIKDFRRVPARDLRPNPKNWRTHPKAQQEALRGILAEVGFADALLARELPDGSLELIDGHLRAETTPDMAVPVLVLDVDQAEADKLLASVDPLAAMAEASREKLDELHAQLQIESAELREMLARITPPPSSDLNSDAAANAPTENRYTEQFGVIVICSDEHEQKSVYERLDAEGFNCRVVVT